MARCRIFWTLSLIFLFSSNVNGQDYRDRNSIYQLVDEFMMSQQPDSAVYYLKSLYDFQVNHDDLLGAAKTQNNIGLLYKRIGEYDLALNAYLTSLKQFEKDKQIELIIASKINIGELYNSLYDFTKSEEFLKDAIYLINKTDTLSKNELYLSFAHTNFGITKQGQKELDSALFHYHKSMALSVKEGDTIGIAYDLNNIGTVYSDKNQNDSALFYYLKSLNLKKQINNLPGVAQSYENIGKAYVDLELYDKAEEYFDSAMALSSQLDMQYLISSIHFNISVMKHELKDFESAFTYLRKGLTISDSLERIDEKLQMNVLQIAYETDKRKQQIALSEARITLLEKEDQIKSNRMNLLIYSLVGLLLLIGALVIMIRLRNRNFKQKEALLDQERKLKSLENQQLINKLDLKNRELSSYMINEQSKKELLQNIQDSIAEISQGNEKSDHRLQEVSKRVQNLLNENNNWQAFRKQFEAIHSGFFNRLTQNHNDLSQNDIRHCAYIKIGLNTKEIASLLNITAAAVQKSRVRLKKKLNLDKSTDLVTYIQTM